MDAHASVIYGHLGAEGPTKEHSEVEGTQACWELRM